MATGSGTTPISEARLLRIIDAYGADPARWPAEERPAALALLDASPRARRRLEEARTLDALLDTAPREAFRADIAPARPARRLWPSLWRPAAALSGAAFAGLLAGAVAAPSTPAQQIPVDSDIIALALGDFDALAEEP